MPSLEITTMIGCPLMCTYCPQDRLKKAYRNSAASVSGFRVVGHQVKNKYLSLEDFSTVLSKVPKHVRIDFSGMAEPWANPDATRMLEIALQDDRPVAIYTTLYGIDSEQCEQILDLLESHLSQLEILCLHLPDANDSMKGWNYSIEYEDILKRFLDFGRRKLSDLLVRESANSTSTRFQVMTMDGSGKICQQLEHLGIELPAWQGHTRAGTLSAEPELTPSLKPVVLHNAAVSCSWTPFYDRNVLLPNGDVVLCCMDYALKHVIGNLLTGDYESLFCSEEMARIRYLNSQPTHSKCSLCKSCDDASVYTLEKTSWIERSDTGFEIVGLESDGWLIPNAEIHVHFALPHNLSLRLHIPEWLPATYPFQVRTLKDAEVLQTILIQSSGDVELRVPLNQAGRIRIDGGQWFRPCDLSSASADNRLLCFRLNEQNIVT